MFGWVEGTYPSSDTRNEAQKLLMQLQKKVSSFLIKADKVVWQTFEPLVIRIVVKFQSHYNLLNYTHWSDLNTMYFSQVTQLVLDTKRSIHNDVSCIPDILYIATWCWYHFYRFAASITIGTRLSLIFQKADTLSRRSKKYTRSEFVGILSSTGLIL